MTHLSLLITVYFIVYIVFMVAITYNFYSADNQPLPTLPIIDVYVYGCDIFNYVPIIFVTIFRYNAIYKHKCLFSSHLDFYMYKCILFMYESLNICFVFVGVARNISLVKVKVIQNKLCIVD